MTSALLEVRDDCYDTGSTIITSQLEPKEWRGRSTVGSWRSRARPRAQQRLVREAIRLLREDPSTLTTFLSYLQEVVGEEALPLVERAAELEEGDAAMRSINQYFEELGRRKGLRAGMKRGLDRGIVRGREDALRSAVTKVLARRFKKLPPSVTQKLAEADVATLEQWLDAALDARSLRAVFH